MQPSPLTDDMTTKEFRQALGDATTPERLRIVANKMLGRLTLMDRVQADAQQTLWWLEHAFEDDCKACIERISRMKADPKPLHQWDPKAWRKMQNFRLSVRQLVASLDKVPAQIIHPTHHVVSNKKALTEDEALTPIFTL
jgi:cytochrome c556